VKGEGSRGIESRQPAEAKPQPEEELLDAWHATYSSALTVEILRGNKQGLMESIQRNVLPSEEGREAVSDHLEEFPWRCICYLIITAADRSRWVGSGWLAGPRTVLTAGHCVYLHGAGGWARQVEVYPGCNGTERPYRLSSKDLWSVRGWTERQRDECDYGAIFLPEPLSIGSFGYEALGVEELRNMQVNVFGYPADKPPGTLWGQAFLLGEVQPRKLVYNQGLFGGHSGSPVFYKEGDERSVVGIHTYGDLFGNTATRITAAVFDNIRAWSARGSG
jgi:V8-like Glu-specific endopeptidase